MSGTDGPAPAAVRDRDYVVEGSLGRPSKRLPANPADNPGGEDRRLSSFPRPTVRGSHAGIITRPGGGVMLAA
jgi:hypothetical protein